MLNVLQSPEHVHFRVDGCATSTVPKLLSPCPDHESLVDGGGAWVVTVLVTVLTTGLLVCLTTVTVRAGAVTVRVGVLAAPHPVVNSSPATPIRNPTRLIAPAS